MNESRATGLASVGSLSGSLIPLGSSLALAEGHTHKVHPPGLGQIKLHKSFPHLVAFVPKLNCTLAFTVSYSETNTSANT